MGGAGGCVAGPFDVITQGYSPTQYQHGSEKSKRDSGKTSMDPEKTSGFPEEQACI
jgi:hypothetical protein